MSYCDSPLGLCETEHTIVLTDQTQEQCAFEHVCPPGRKCPLHGCFARVSGITEGELADGLPALYRHRSSELWRSNF